MAKIIGNTTATPNPRSDWNQTDETKADYIKNKPTNLASQDDIAAAIDIIDMGGRNLIIDGEFNKESAVWGTESDMSLNFDNGYLILSRETSSNQRYGYYQSSSKNSMLLNPENGQSYTLSVEIMKLPDMEISDGSTVEIHYHVAGSMVRFTVNIPTDLEDNKWTKVSGTKVYESDVPTTVSAYIQLGKSAGGFACRNIKLEKSSLADVWAAINEIKSVINEIKGISEV